MQDAPPAIRPYYDDGRGIVIYHGDCEEIAAYLDPVDLILTDPPYHVETMHLYSSLGRIAEAGLVDGGWLITYAGVYTMPTALSLIEEVTSRLSYRWCLPLLHREGQEQIGNIAEMDVLCTWKPILAFRKRPFGSERFKLNDRLRSAGRNAKAHPWEQTIGEVSQLLQKFPGATILDPFMGSGTTLRAAKDLGRRAIGIEIEEKYCEIAANRLRQEVLL
jgi:predicted methyltransferase